MTMTGDQEIRNSLDSMLAVFPSPWIPPSHWAVPSRQRVPAMYLAPLELPISSPNLQGANPNRTGGKTSRSKKSKSRRSRSKARSRGVPPYLVRNVKSLQFGNPRGRATRGWKFLAPKPGTARHSLKSKCGSKAFLEPSHEGFPVMTLHSPGCHYDCRGLHAAYSRAQQFGHPGAASKARSLIAKHC